MGTTVSAMRFLLRSLFFFEILFNLSNHYEQAILPLTFLFNSVIEIFMSPTNLAEA